MGDEEGSVDGYGGTALFVFIPYPTAPSRTFSLI